MKPFIEDIKKMNGICSFYAYSFKTHKLEFRWHKHPEYELTFVIKGNGYRLIGNHKQDYFDNDFVLIGPNIPHTWVGKIEEDKEPFEKIVIQFTKEFITRFEGLDETKPIFQLLENSKQVLFFTTNQNNYKKLLFDIIVTEGFGKINKLIQLLSQLAQAKYTVLLDKSYKLINNEINENRINKILVYLQDNFSNKIQLKKIATLINQSESNFCKFFKKSTGKTFSNYLNEIRINEVCHQLLYSDKSIKEIAYQTGFETVSYFNRIFLKLKKISPKKFRKLNLIF